MAGTFYKDHRCFSYSDDHCSQVFGVLLFQTGCRLIRNFHQPDWRGSLDTTPYSFPSHLRLVHHCPSCLTGLPNPISYSLGLVFYFQNRTWRILSHLRNENGYCSVIVIQACAQVYSWEHGGDALLCYSFTLRGYLLWEQEMLGEYALLKEQDLCPLWGLLDWPLL